ncbi:hypothetical protein FB45DRAFT_1065566 [Roridomyces roridus]|uniref:F-box domain-containing protein n=1 Tax=Roridomyces roridus TaxID=1738132 RepID=A0AAD7B763_9AGAR|nr:hypothetical protein FB45DRAFT_1065566 [Roridomyces roridus]
MFFGLFTPKIFPPILEWLPDDVLIEIIRFAPCRADRAALCRTSKLFYELSLPILNQTVVLYLRDTMTTERATAVRSLTFWNIGPRCGLFELVEQPPSKYNLFFKSLHLMKSLVDLSFDDRWDADGECFPSRLAFTAFPRIRKLAILNPTSDSARAAVARFFSLHPGLTHVCLGWYRGAKFEYHQKWDDALSLLPNLQHYQGFNRTLLDACCTRTLRAARFQADGWPCLSVESIFATLQSRTIHSRHIPFTLSLNYRWTDERLRNMLIAVSGYMPHIRCLQMRCHNDTLNTTTVQVFTEPLRHFGRIEYFPLNYCPSYEFDLRLPWNYRRCRRAAQMLGEACPTLRACCIGSRAWKKVAVDEQWVEYTRDAFEVDAGLSEFVEQN